LNYELEELTIWSGTFQKLCLFLKQ